jgi:hypothetical protein
LLSLDCYTIPDDISAELELLGDRRFGSGIVYLRDGVDV